VLLGSPPQGVELDPADRRALEALAAGGLVPRLRLVPLHPPPARPAGEGGCGGPDRDAGRAV